MMNNVIRPSGLQAAVGISDSTAYRLEKKGLFPRRRELSVGAVGWTRAELEAWLESNNRR